MAISFYRYSAMTKNPRPLNSGACLLQIKTYVVNDMNDEELFVTVCAACYLSCCWQGEFMCDDARGAGTIDLSVAELKKLALEHEHYWCEASPKSTE